MITHEETNNCRYCSYAAEPGHTICLHCDMERSYIYGITPELPRETNPAGKSDIELPEEHKR